jgi:hypothetical protein
LDKPICPFILYLWRHEIIKSTGWIHSTCTGAASVQPFLYSTFPPMHAKKHPNITASSRPRRLLPFISNGELLWGSSTAFWVCRRELRGENSDKWLRTNGCPHNQTAWWLLVYYSGVDIKNPQKLPGSSIFAQKMIPSGTLT